MHRRANEYFDNCMQYIASETELEVLGRQLKGVALLAADTEAAGYHRYSDRICLLQLSTRDATYIVDTLTVSHLDPLRDVFTRSETEIVFHDADYDLRLLARDFDLHVAFGWITSRDLRRRQRRGWA